MDKINKNLQNLLKKIKSGIEKRKKTAKSLNYKEAIEHLSNI